MSEAGKLRRGEKWYSFRDLNGNLPPEIKNDPEKMSDVNFFLEHKGEKEETEQEEKTEEEE